MIKMPINSNSNAQYSPLSNSSSRNRRLNWGKVKAHSIQEEPTTMKDLNQQKSIPRSTSSNMLEDLAASFKNDTTSFEVLYLGKLHMSGSKAPITYIDDAIEKFKLYEQEKAHKKAPTDGRRTSFQESSKSFISNSSSVNKPHSNNLNDKISDGNLQSSSKDAGEDQTDLCFTPSIRKISSTTNGAHTAEENAFVQYKNDENLGKDLFDKKKELMGTSTTPSRISHPLEDVTYQKISNCNSRSRNASGDAVFHKRLSIQEEPQMYMRSRAMSTGQYPGFNPKESDDSTTKFGTSLFNRTMILILGKREFRLISPDAKTILTTKGYKDICHSALGLTNKDCFGFITRETSSKNIFIGYVFRCESPHVANDILQAMRQAHSVTLENLRKDKLCENCPMVWYGVLCSDMEGMSADKTFSLIMKRLDQLPEVDKNSLMNKFSGSDIQDFEGKNELLLMLLRAHCEQKQLGHFHDQDTVNSDTNRHNQEFLDKETLLLRAKRSFTNSLGTIIKRKGPLSSPTPPIPNSGYTAGSLSVSDENKSSSIKTMLSPGNNKDLIVRSPLQRNNSTIVGSNEDQISKNVRMIVSDSPLDSTPSRPRSSTVGSSYGDRVRSSDFRNRHLLSGAKANSPFTSTPFPSPNVNSSTVDDQTIKQNTMRNLFLKVGSQSHKSTPGSGLKSPSQEIAWRQAIFKRVITPSASTPSSHYHQHHQHAHNLSYASASTPISSRNSSIGRRPRSKSEIRGLWKAAIRQQMILNAMEKQNHLIAAKQQAVNVKRNKLSYRNLGTCDEESTDTWDIIISEEQKNPYRICDRELLNSAILRGIPKTKRGTVWQFFINQSKKIGEFKSNCIVNQNHVSYDSLLHDLTSHQHAILIDLGRTFPNHPYFNSPLGSGQLALFNILKGYSLLDPNVGYCQGLSFVAGLLLMHLEEEESFQALIFLMFNLGAREHYKPDMKGLQVKLYQLTRLIHDLDSDISILFHKYDVAPSLYAAPWFLTMFASQFPIGFVVRILDLVFLHGVDVITTFALVLIMDNKYDLLKCVGLEQIMDCLKNEVTSITSEKVDIYIKRVLEMEKLIDKQRQMYAVEYQVMHDLTFNERDLSSLKDESMNILTVDKSVQTEENDQMYAQLSRENGDLRKQNEELIALVQKLTENSPVNDFVPLNLTVIPSYSNDKTIDSSNNDEGVGSNNTSPLSSLKCDSICDSMTTSAAGKSPNNNNFSQNSHRSDEHDPETKNNNNGRPSQNNNIDQENSNSNGDSDDSIPGLIHPKILY